MPNVHDFARHFTDYRWQAKHHLYGYPPDTCGTGFPWIASLEQRFGWLVQAHAERQTVPVYLLKEMIQWGGSQNGVLQKFEDGIGEVNLRDLLADVVRNVAAPRAAIEAALEFPGLGLTYASKLLRFLDPTRYGALDSRLRAALTDAVRGEPQIPRIRDGSRRSIVEGYCAFLDYLERLRVELNDARIVRPECPLAAGPGTGWRAADIEMALFQWAETQDA